MSSDTFVKVDRYNLCDSFLCSLAVIFKTIRRWPTHGSSIASAGVGRAGLFTAGQAEPHNAKAALVAWQGIHWNTQRKAEKWTSFWEAIRSDWHIRLARKRSPVTLQPETHIPCWSSGKIKHVALPGVTKGVAKSIFISGKKNQVDKAVKFLFLIFCVFPPVQSVLPCARCDWDSDTLQWKMSDLPHPVHRCEQQLSVNQLYMLKGYHLNSVQKHLLTKTLSLNGTSK